MTKKTFHDMLKLLEFYENNTLGDNTTIERFRVNKSRLRMISIYFNGDNIKNILLNNASEFRKRFNVKKVIEKFYNEGNKELKNLRNELEKNKRSGISDSNKKLFGAILMVGSIALIMGRLLLGEVTDFLIRKKNEIVGNVEGIIKKYQPIFDKWCNEIKTPILRFLNKFKEFIKNIKEELKNAIKTVLLYGLKLVVLLVTYTIKGVFKNLMSESEKISDQRYVKTILEEIDARASGSIDEALLFMRNLLSSSLGYYQYLRGELARRLGVAIRGRLRGDNTLVFRGSDNKWYKQEDLIRILENQSDYNNSLFVTEDKRTAEYKELHSMLYEAGLSLEGEMQNQKKIFDLIVDSIIGRTIQEGIPDDKEHLMLVTSELSSFLGDMMILIENIDRSAKTDLGLKGGLVSAGERKSIEDILINLKHIIEKYDENFHFTSDDDTHVIRIRHVRDFYRGAILRLYMLLHVLKYRYNEARLLKELIDRNKEFRKEIEEREKGEIEEIEDKELQSKENTRKITNGLWYRIIKRLTKDWFNEDGTYNFKANFYSLRNVMESFFNVKIRKDEAKENNFLYGFKSFEQHLRSEIKNITLDYDENVFAFLSIATPLLLISSNNKEDESFFDESLDNAEIVNLGQWNFEDMFKVIERTIEALNEEKELREKYAKAMWLHNVLMNKVCDKKKAVEDIENIKTFAESRYKKSLSLMKSKREELIREIENRGTRKLPLFE